MSGKRVLAFGTNRMCFDRLHDLGHEIVLFVPKGRARPEDPAGPYCHLVVLDDSTPTAEWVQLASVFHGADPFDAVVAYNEHTYPQVAAVARELSIPTVVDADLYERVRDKFAARRALEACGVPSCRYAIAHTRDQVRAAVDATGYPCIVKPISGEASLGVARIDTAADVDCAMAWVGADQLESGVLVEEFLAGQEVSVEAISVGHTHHIVAITQKYASATTFIEEGHVVPATLDPAVSAMLPDYVAQVLDALGFHDCPSHTEVMVTTNGPRLIETHNRVAGDSIIDLARLATGVDLYDLTVAQSIGDPVSVPDDISARGSAAVWFAAPSEPEGKTLAGVRNLETARTEPGVVRVELIRRLGSGSTEVRQSSDRSAYAIAVGGTPGTAVRRAREAVGRLEFVYGAPESHRNDQ